MARRSADSPGRHTTRQATYLLVTLTFAGVVLLWSTATMRASVVDGTFDDTFDDTVGPGSSIETGSYPSSGMAQLLPDGSIPELIEAPSIRRPGSADETGPERVEAPSITPEQKLGAEAMAHITYPWRDRLDRGWTIDFLPRQDGLYGLTKVSERRIEVYVRLDRDIDFLVHVIAHELGHAVDVSLFGDDQRDRWRRQRELGDAPWWPNNAASDFSTGAGDFAESFAAWQTGGTFYRGELANAPSNNDLSLLMELSEFSALRGQSDL